MKAHLINALKLAIGLGLLLFLYRNLQDPALLWQQLVNANFGLLLIGAFCYTTAVALGGLKWNLLLRAQGIPVPTSRLLSYHWMAQFVNNFLPAQVGGDVLRGYNLATDTKRAADAAASVIIDSFTGLTAFMLAAAISSTAMLFQGRPNGVAFSSDEALAMQVISVGSILCTLLMLGTLFALMSQTLKRFVERLLSWLPLSGRTVPIWQKLADAFGAYRHQYRAILLTGVSSLIIVLLTSINIWLIALALQPNSISLIEVLVINPLIAFVSLVPITPGGLGLRQWAFQNFFLLVGANGGIGFAVGLLQQAIGYLVSLPGGYLWLRGRRNVKDNNVVT